MIIHFLVGIGGQYLGLFGSVQKPQAVEKDPIQVTLLTPQPVTPRESGTADKAPVAPAPPPTPRPIRQVRNQVKPPPPDRKIATAVRPTPVPSAVLRPTPTTAARPTPKRPTEVQRPLVLPDRTPTETAISPQITPRTPQTTGGNLSDRLPEPLPPGDLAGNPDTPEVSRETRRPTTVRIATVPRRTTEGGGGSEGGENRIPENSSNPGAPVGPGADKGGAGDGEGGVRGDARGTRSGAVAAIGIDRGIPFGDKLGIYGGNPAGGGGTGRGPGGAAVDASVSTDGGKFRVSLKRTSAAESGSPAAKIAYVLDVSWSMHAGGKMNRAHEALHKALDELRPDDQFTIVTFANDARSMPRMLAATRAGLSIGHANVSASQPEPGGATNLSAAIDLALGLPGVTHVFILSDGEPTEGITDPAELLSFTRKKNSRKARIITMALINSNDKKGFTLLKEIAEQHNGLFDFVDVR